MPAWPPLLKRTTEASGVASVQRVLLVEDEEVNRHVIARMLEKMGITVLSAEDGQQALEVLQDEEEVDCVFMDVEMPVMGGIEATQAIRNSPELAGSQRIYIIALTAHSMTGDKEKFLQAGMDDYLAKPVALGSLHSVLQRVDRHARQSP